MSRVFQNIDPPHPSTPGECVPPSLLRGEDTLAGLEDARHSSVLYLYRILFGKSILCQLSPLYEGKYCPDPEPNPLYPA
jgi:hypothetical protein